MFHRFRSSRKPYGFVGENVGSSYVSNCWKTAFFKHCMQLIFVILNLFRINVLFLYMRN